MGKIMIFAGTSEGRKLAERLKRCGIEPTLSVATEYGKLVLNEDDFKDLRVGRLDEEDMKKLWASGEFSVVVDCTHPFATEVTKNIRNSLKDTKIPYFRLARDLRIRVTGKEQIMGKEQIIGAEQIAGTNQTTGYDQMADDGRLITVADAASCAKALKETTGTILLTTGSKELAVFCEDESVKKRLVVRVLPGMESLELCKQNGLEGKQIIAMQGPFTQEMNLATIRQYHIDCLVTKASGKTGGEDTKISAAMEAGIPCYIINPPAYDEEIKEYSEEEVWKALGKIFDLSKEKTGTVKVTLAGIGMGDPSSLTVAVKNTIERADYLFGAQRMIREFNPRKEKYPYYTAADILPCLQSLQEKTPEGFEAVILFSGDTGFYSGCDKMIKALSDAGSYEFHVLPGISSLSALAAACGTSWNDAYVISAHGTEQIKWESEVLHAIRYGKKAFLLTSGCKDVQRLGELLTEFGLEEKVRIRLGFQLSYPDEKVWQVSAAECRDVVENGLYVAFLEPIDDALSFVTPGLPDDSFVRGKVPMTKEEVRTISISKLHLKETSVVYDIGSGTGSVSLEIALCSPMIKVYALECNTEGIELTKENAKHMAIRNVIPIETMAPEGLEELETPTHAFIGGSKGKLREILQILYKKNPHMRVVVNAISLETIALMQTLLKEFPIAESEILTVSVDKAKEIGSHHLMQAQNPVTIYAFTFKQQ